MEDRFLAVRAGRVWVPAHPLPVLSPLGPTPTLSRSSSPLAGPSPLGSSAAVSANPVSPPRPSPALGFPLTSMPNTPSLYLHFSLSASRSLHPTAPSDAPWGWGASQLMMAEWLRFSTLSLPSHSQTVTWLSSRWQPKILRTLGNLPLTLIPNHCLRAHTASCPAYCKTPLPGFRVYSCSYVPRLPRSSEHINHKSPLAFDFPTASNYTQWRQEQWRLTRTITLTSSEDALLVYHKPYLTVNHTTSSSIPLLPWPWNLRYLVSFTSLQRECAAYTLTWRVLPP